MSELPDDIRRALEELPRERQPDPALEDRVIRAVFGRSRRWVWTGGLIAVAAALLLVVTQPWSRAQATGHWYVLLLSEPPGYVDAPPGQLRVRQHEYGLWADSLDRLGKLDRAGHLEPPTPVDGLFIIRAVDDADAARIAATCPHNKYHGHIDIRRFIE